MNMRLRNILAVLFFVFLGICLGAIPSGAEPTGRITVQQNAEVGGPEILLGDIATLEGAPEHIQTLERITVGRAPLPGKERRVSREQIVAALRQQGIAVKTIEITCPREVTVTGKSREFSAEELEAIIRSFIFANMPWEAQSVSIEDVSAKPVQLPPGDINYRVSVQPGEDYLGKFNADIIFKVNGKETQRTRVSAVIRVTVPVAVSAKAIERHALFSRDDIIMETKDLSALPKGVVTDPHQLEGKRLKISISAGTLLRHEMFEADTEVRKGDIVTLACNAPLFSITAPAEALAGGNQGDVIPVMNLTSKNKVFGYIKNNKVVEVHY
ncbi:MAG: flagellar basal body P-ring formation chaperone FlgA [Desulfobacterota bacterium]|nr:flagellar basal body P-ring formation chaperone FlgA [Thermodesulfobacteriota bacterium]